MATERTNPPSGAIALSNAAIAALSQGNKVAAIKIVREERGIGLKEAKDAVDGYVEAHPTLRTSMAAAQGEAKRVALLAVAAALGLALVAWWFLAGP